jgi:hypothetical protein
MIRNEPVTGRSIVFCGELAMPSNKPKLRSLQNVLQRSVEPAAISGRSASGENEKVPLSAVLPKFSWRHIGGASERTREAGL